MDRLELLEHAEKSRETTDPFEASKLALDLSLSGVNALSEAAKLELTRKDTLLAIRDRLMSEKGLAKTPAEDEARRDEHYVKYVGLIDSLGTIGERAKAYARYFETRATLLALRQEATANV